METGFDGRVDPKRFRDMRGGGRGPDAGVQRVY